MVMKYLTLLLMLACASVHAEIGINLGFFTEHLSRDKPEYNEDNELVQLTYADEDGYEYSIATFSNSHFVRSHLIGWGYRWGNFGLGLAAVHGYEGYITSHIGDIIFMPVMSYDAGPLKFNFVGNVVSVGVQHKF